MANAARDANYVPTLLATDNTDGATPMRVSVDPVTHGLDTSDNTTGSDLSGDIASRDANYVPVLMGVSSADGVTPTAVYGDPATGALLIDST
jgi:hypothetical protein